MNTQDAQIHAAVKLALEFNAGIISLCTLYYGNMDEKNYKKFIRHYDKIIKQYQTDLGAIFNEES